MSDDENDDKLTAGENKINICQINEMITCKVKRDSFENSCEHSPSDLLWLLGRCHHSDRMPAHILQGNIPHLSCIHLLTCDTAELHSETPRGQHQLS